MPLRLIREKFPDLQNQPHEVAVARAELSHAPPAPIAAHKNRGALISLTLFAGQPGKKRVASGVRVSRCQNSE